MKVALFVKGPTHNKDGNIHTKCQLTNADFGLFINDIKNFVFQLQYPIWAVIAMIVMGSLKFPEITVQTFRLLGVIQSRTVHKYHIRVFYIGINHYTTFCTGKTTRTR